jgi:Arc/MetJ-type ribon-helix-helix transcriptional regulator
MLQSKISFEEKQLKFINKYREIGFKDKSSLVRAAIDEFRKKIERKKLEESANLYAELYETDDELKELTDSAIDSWPK